MDGERISDGAARKVEIIVRKNGRKDKVIVEKSAAEGLPEGWIKKLVITNREGRKNRRDPFFIDPKSRYIFQSFKDASRYVETGKIGNYARKLKESDIEDYDSGNGKTALPLESVEKRSADLLEMEKKLNIHVRSSKRRNLSSSQEHSENCNMNSDLSSITSQAFEDSRKKEEANDSIEKHPIAKRVTRSQAKASKNREDRDLKRKNLPSSYAKSEEDTVQSRLSTASSQDPGKESIMKGEAVQNSTEKQITRNEAKVKTGELSNSVARRASKRLAGIELDPTPELKTRTKTQRTGSSDDDLMTRTKAQQTVPLDDESMLELKTKTKAQRTVPHDEQTPELKTGAKAQRIVPPDDVQTPELKTGAKAQRTVPPDDEQTPELKTGAIAQRIVPLDDGTAGKCNQPVNPVVTRRLKKTDKHLNKEVAKSYYEHPSQKPYAAATNNNRMSAETAVGIEKIGKPVGRNPSIDKKKLKMPLMISEVELNPVFHLDGYKQKEEMSPVSPLSRQTSATNCEKTAAGKKSSKTKLTTSVKATEIPPLDSSNKGNHPHPSDSGNAIQRRNKLGNELSNSPVVRGACSEVKDTNNFSSAFDSTLADIWKDPCFAFAIKMLTGESLRLPNTSAIPSDPMIDHAKQEGVAFFPETPGNDNTGSEKQGFSSVTPDVDIWKDPCIDFAIKTLTGAIPIGLDELDAKSKSEGMPITTAASQKGESKQSNCDYMVRQCNMKSKTG